MKLLSLCIFLLFISFSAIGQIKAIKVTNQDSKKEIIFKNKNRVKVKTNDERKIRGKLFIQDEKIYINNIIVDPEDISFIKKDPLLIYILTSSFLLYSGASLAGVAFILGVLVDSSLLLLGIPAGVLFYTGLKAPNFNKKYSLDNRWTLELIEIPEDNIRTSTD